MAKRLKPYGAGYEKPDKVVNKPLTKQLRDYKSQMQWVMTELENFGSKGTDWSSMERAAPPPPKKDQWFIEPGDVVICMRDGTRDPDGLPKDVPLEGHRYIVHSFYLAPYGMGVVLNNLDGTPLDNYPYRGYKFGKPSLEADRWGTRQRAVITVLFKKDDEDGTA